MLKVHPKFRIYDKTPKKAAKGLIQAGFISDDTLGCMLNKVLKDRKNLTSAETLDAIIDKMFDTRFLTYTKVRVNDNWLLHSAGLLSDSDLSKLNMTGAVTYYDVWGVDKPMTLEGIFTRYGSSRGNFVTICHKCANGSLGLTGIVV